MYNIKHGFYKKNSNQKFVNYKINSIEDLFKRKHDTERKRKRYIITNEKTFSFNNKISILLSAELYETPLDLDIAYRDNIISNHYHRLTIVKNKDESYTITFFEGDNILFKIIGRDEKIELYNESLDNEYFDNFFENFKKFFIEKMLFDFILS